MRFTKLKTILLLILLVPFIKLEPHQQRGTWLARNSFASKELLASQMDSLANNNFNVVYVNLWSRGYPLWKSDVFFSHTGMYIDPTYNGRDILAEAIAEGHRNGLHVVAWFEYGFVGGWTGNMPPGQKGPIFNAHPDWVARRQNGLEKDTNNFYWMIHVHQPAQNFLIAMAAEIARNYDVDGIQLDRIRYSSKEYGYDSVTVNLYKSEHGGASPPANISNSSWIRWRADKLNNFVARFYDSIKTINSYLQISNAPGHYSSTSPRHIMITVKIGYGGLITIKLMMFRFRCMYLVPQHLVITLTTLTQTLQINQRCIHRLLLNRAELLSAMHHYYNFFKSLLKKDLTEIQFGFMMT